MTFPVEMVAELAQHPNVIGIKDSSGSLERIRNCRGDKNSASADGDGDTCF